MLAKSSSIWIGGLTAAALGWHLPKTLTKSDWETNKLTEAMKQYAAADAFVALDLLDALVDTTTSSSQDGTCTAELVRDIIKKEGDSRTSAEQVRDIIKKEGGSMEVPQFVQKYMNIYGKRPFGKGKATKALKELAKSRLFGMIESKADSTFFLTSSLLYLSRDGACTSYQVRDIIEMQGGSMNVSQFVQKYISIYGNMPFKKGKATKGLKELAKSGHFGIKCKANGSTFFLTSTL